MSTQHLPDGQEEPAPGPDPRQLILHTVDIGDGREFDREEFYGDDGR